ncbi:MAG: glycosyl transferase, family 9 [Candidatus Solibacter sp.]|nr:glycosyl transferase, family 9 [Candidatus Solibacter sp.]
MDCLPRGSRVAILRLRSLGDCVLTTPALDILKRYRPDLHLAIVVEDRFREIFEGSPDLDEILSPNLPALRSFRPQLCVNLHGGTRSAWMTELSGAGFRAGFGHYRQQFIYNVRIPRAQEILGVERTVHTAEHLASAMFYLGVPRVEIPRARLIPPRRSDVSTISTAVLHAQASSAEKTWPVENFLEVAGHLRENGLDPIFIGAAGDDLSAFAGFRTVQGAPLSEIKVLLAGASLFVGNDSGPAHMAAAFGLPTVVVFSASDPEIWGPWRTAGEVVRAPAGVEQVLDALHRVKAAA